MVKEEEKERRTQHPGLIFMLGRDTITVIIHGTLCRKETIFFKKRVGLRDVELHLAHQPTRMRLSLSDGEFSQNTHTY
jgi:hypothetical protein